MDISGSTCTLPAGHRQLSLDRPFADRTVTRRCVDEVNGAHGHFRLHVHAAGWTPSAQFGSAVRRSYPSAYISGISFRKAVLQKLKDMGMSPSQVATYATHKTLAAQMNYVAATVESCAEVAAALYTGL